MKNQPRVILIARVNNRTSTCYILTLCCKLRCFNRYDWCVVNIFDVHIIQSILYWDVCHQNPWKYWDIILAHRCRATHTCTSKSLVLIILGDSGIHLIKFKQQFRCRKMPKFECVNEMVWLNVLRTMESLFKSFGLCSGELSLHHYITQK